MQRCTSAASPTKRARRSPFAPGSASRTSSTTIWARSDGQAAQQTGDSLAAAAYRERYLLQMLPVAPNLRYIYWYPRLTCTIHALRAKGLLAQGKRAEALHEIDLAEQAQPNCTELPILLFTDLEKAGEQEKAAQLFERVYRVLAKNCREYPNCANAHNLLAWLSARCRRQLDDALPHALKAVELSARSRPISTRWPSCTFNAARKRKPSS